MLYKQERVWMVELLLYSPECVFRRSAATKSCSASRPSWNSPPRDASTSTSESTTLWTPWPTPSPPWVLPLKLKPAHSKARDPKSKPRLLVLRRRRTRRSACWEPRNQSSRTWWKTSRVSFNFSTPKPQSDPTDVFLFLLTLFNIIHCTNIWLTVW